MGALKEVEVALNVASAPDAAAPDAAAPPLDATIEEGACDRRWGPKGVENCSEGVTD